MTRGFYHLQVLKALCERDIPVGSPQLPHQRAEAMARKGWIKVTLCGIGKTASITDAGKRWMEECGVCR